MKKKSTNFKGPKTPAKSQWLPYFWNQQDHHVLGPGRLGPLVPDMLEDLPWLPSCSVVCTKLSGLSTYQRINVKATKNTQMTEQHTILEGKRVDQNL